MSRQAPKPFRFNTRQRIARVTSVAFAASQQLPSIRLPKVGFLNRIFVTISGAMTLSSAGALQDLGPWNLINRFKLNTNIGAATIFDTSGYGAYLMSGWSERSFLPDRAGIGNTTAHADVHAAPVASGANNWVLNYVIPVACNAGMNFDTGLINLQSVQTEVTLDIVCGAVLDAATNATGFVGNIEVWYEYYEVPADPQAQLPPLVLHRVLEEVYPITATGEQQYVIPKMGRLLGLFHLIRCNGARSDSIDQLSVRFNRTDEPYRIPKRVLRLRNRLQLGTDLPVGAYLLDLWHSSEDVGEGDLRDAIDSEAIATLESNITVTSGTTLGAGNNSNTVIRRLVQVLEAA